jgi:hypothetical protein
MQYDIIMSSVISTACYYVIDNGLVKLTHQAHFYDRDGNLLKTVPLEIMEYYSQKLIRLEEMIDPLFRHKARPVKIVYSLNSAQTRIISFYDKNGNVIDSQVCPDGPTNLIHLNDYFCHRRNARSYDFEWILEQNIPIYDHVPIAKPWCIVM